MKKNKNGLLHYFRLEPKLAQQLDKRIARAGYQSRSEFFTAVAHIALHGDETEIRAQTARQTDQHLPLPENIRTWLKNTMPAASEDEIQQQLQQLINDILFPVIAMKGKDIAFHATWQDIRSAYHDQTGIWVTESDLYQAYETFAAVNKTALTNYRNRQLTQPEEEP